MIKIACGQYQIEEHANWDNYVIKIEKMVSDAKQAGASLLVMPEYAGIEAVCKKFKSDEDLFYALQPLIAEYIELYKRLAKIYQIYIQAGTIIEKLHLGKFVNRAYLFSPYDAYGYQDKLQLTEDEKQKNLFQHTEQQKIFNTSFGKVGIAICYDSEFPEIVRRLVQAGAAMILVPSYTTSCAGYYRVHLSCRARAIENQCYVATAYVVNKVSLSDEIDETYGQAAIFGPADLGFPDDGIVVQGNINTPMLVFGEISFAALDTVRRQGQVHNYEDAARCAQIEMNAITEVSLQDS